MNQPYSKQSTTGELETFLAHKILHPGTDAYNKAIDVWPVNYHKPAIICLCETNQDVQAAVILADKKQLRLSVRGGGNDWQGRSLVDGGLVIDLSKMKRISIDKQTMVADIEGGVNIRELVDAADAVNMMAVVGTFGSVGVAGFTLAGGYGLLSPSYGLGVDNLLSADVVLADGRLITTSKTENPDLLWALQGGGGNFGVVTGMRIRLYPGKRVVSGMSMFPLSEAERVMAGYNKIMKSAPAELYIFTTTLLTPDGFPALLLSSIWNGDVEKGKQQIAAIHALGNAFMQQSTPMKLRDMVESFDAFIVGGYRNYVKTLWVSEMTPQINAAIVEAVGACESKFSKVSFVHLHGAATRVPLEATAFGLRDDHYMIIITAQWEPSDDANSATHKKWTDNLYNKLAPHALPGGYTNLLGKDDKEQIAHAHGINKAKLKAIKKVYDPNNVFSAQPLAI